MNTLKQSAAVLATACALALAGLPAAVGAKDDKDTGGGFGLELRTSATAKDVEMPSYPKAEVVPEPDGDAGAVRMGLWSPGFGFKLAALKLTSGDAPTQVAAFYREALARHGSVIECTAQSPVVAKSASRGDDDKLGCDEDRPKAGSLVLKVGTRKDFRLVAIHPRGNGTQFDLVRIAVRH